jgi:hypothetical protein
MAFLDVAVINSLNELKGNHVQTEEISLDDELLKQLSVFNLLSEPIQLQDHFIKVQQAVKTQYIEVVGWERLGFEIRYSFLREQEKAVFRTYINGQNEFRKPFSSMPNLSPSSTFNDVLADLLNHLPNITVKRNTTETIIRQIEFDLNVEEEFPFTRSLYDDLIILFKDTNIIIDEIEHMQFKERYAFKRNNEEVTLDFEYKKNGFFGRIVPVQNKINSQLLLSDIKLALSTFNQESYAS